MRIWTNLFLFILLTIFATASRASDNPPLALAELPDLTISQGQYLYQRYCLFCHGENGEGDGQNAFSVPKRPADLNEVAPERNDEQLFTVIKHGGAKNNLSPAMPSFEHTLSERQINRLIIYLKTFRKKQEIRREMLPDKTDNIKKVGDGDINT